MQKRAQESGSHSLCKAATPIHASVPGDRYIPPTAFHPHGSRQKRSHRLPAKGVSKRTRTGDCPSSNRFSKEESASPLFGKPPAPPSGDAQGGSQVPFHAPTEPKKLPLRNPRRERFRFSSARAEAERQRENKIKKGPDTRRHPKNSPLAAVQGRQQAAGTKY
ncbi:uncharacterized protein Tco025E_10144 [Trypanosoma conorhini]|uniref:Uncharacterized protein n=1 Tax=Trypanosoma conorhini TaxID=83891 RepID=A0A422MPK8_9TRYP|nr:uncharacterized protein Tco025E_10144 [Trypanosoma conorhini]RNE95155.1 hypothetical protein Tco025E_10144 [Trypanosoma conorhini]